MKGTISWLQFSCPSQRYSRNRNSHNQASPVSSRWASLRGLGTICAGFTNLGRTSSTPTVREQKADGYFHFSSQGASWWGPTTPWRPTRPSSVVPQLWTLLWFWVRPRSQGRWGRDSPSGKCSKVASAVLRGVWSDYETTQDICRSWTSGTRSLVFSRLKAWANVSRSFRETSWLGRNKTWASEIKATIWRLKISKIWVSSSASDGSICWFPGTWISSRPLTSVRPLVVISPHQPIQRKMMKFWGWLKHFPSVWVNTYLS